MWIKEFYFTSGPESYVFDLLHRIPLRLKLALVSPKISKWFNRAFINLLSYEPSAGALIVWPTLMSPGQKKDGNSVWIKDRTFHSLNTLFLKLNVTKQLICYTSCCYDHTLVFVFNIIIISNTCPSSSSSLDLWICNLKLHVRKVWVVLKCFCIHNGNATVLINFLFFWSVYPKSCIQLLMSFREHTGSDETLRMLMKIQLQSWTKNSSQSWNIFSLHYS